MKSQLGACSGISSGNRHGTSAHSISDYPAFSIPNRR